MHVASFNGDVWMLLSGMMTELPHDALPDATYESGHGLVSGCHHQQFMTFCRPWSQLIEVSQTATLCFLQVQLVSVISYLTVWFMKPSKVPLAYIGDTQPSAGRAWPQGTVELYRL